MLFNKLIFHFMCLTIAFTFNLTSYRECDSSDMVIGLY